MYPMTREFIQSPLSFFEGPAPLYTFFIGILKSKIKVFKGLGNKSLIAVGSLVN